MATALAMVSLVSFCAAGAVRPADSGGAGEGVREYLRMVGIGNGTLGRFVDGRPLSEDDTESLLSILYQLRRLDRVSLERWTDRRQEIRSIVAEPDAYRGCLVLVEGDVVAVTPVDVPAAWRDRFDMRRYFVCRLEVPGEPIIATVVTSCVPRSWLDGRPLDEPARTHGLFIKLEGDLAENPRPVLIAPYIGWYPRKNDTARGVGFGMVELGKLGMDVGLWDDVRNRETITAAQREPFYQLLAAVDRLSPDALMALARKNLRQGEKAWLDEAQTFERELQQRTGSRQQEATSERAGSASLDDLRGQLATVRRSLAAARLGRSSVVPLFNEPDQQFGAIVLLEGTVRRVAKIYVQGAAGGHGTSDIEERFGFDHYYELDLFTDDSGPNPLIVCVRRLPAGFPAGSKLNESVRVAAFFFKTWAFTADRRASGDAEQTSPVRRRWQLAPLLIGNQPIRILPAQIASYPLLGLIGGGLFVLLLVVIGLLVWRYDREDRRVRRQRTTEPLSWEMEGGAESESEASDAGSCGEKNVGDGPRRPDSNDR